MALEPNIPDPDWDRFRVSARGGEAPVGDPTRWGAQAFTRVAITAVVGEGNIYSGQILQVATMDNYARPWSIVGSLTMPRSAWQSDGVVLCMLECTIGVGQVQATQSIVLKWRTAGTAANAGLCQLQSVLNGGPYFPTFLEPSRADVKVNLADETRAFAAIGALVGQSISIRANYMYDGSVLPELPFVSKLVLLMTPYAAGEGL